MPTLTIDEKQVTVPEGTSVIQAAERMGIFIPRYCYHPGLSIAGNCRICLVEIEKAPKLQIACNTPCAEGMVVRTRSKAVSEGQQAVLEFLLANHPLDCPVCDQSGECDLQNFYMQYGRYDPRFEEQKVKKVKAVPLGPTVMLDAERCILCSRCERFTDEISKTGEFGIFNRGDRAQIGLYPGKTLDNPYSGNVVDICPVGALTDRDFRFKARVWYLSTAPSICTGCAQGCNIDLHFVTDRPHLADGARVMRVKPRYNPEVNQWWMCDEGRYGYKFIDQGRLRQVRAGERQVTWTAALSELARALSRAQEETPGEGVAVLASAQMTTEELFLVRRIFKESLGLKHCSLEVPEPKGTQDDFLIKADKNPNRMGAALLGLTDGAAKESGPPLIEQALSGQIQILWVFGHDLAALFGEEKVRNLSQRLSQLVFVGSNENGTSRHAHWVLPSTVYAEKEGSFVNCHGRAQRIRKAFEPLAQARPEWQILLELARLLKIPLPGQTPAEIFASLAESVPAFRGLTHERMGEHGVPVKIKNDG